MKKRRIDLTGQRFGRLTVKEFAYTKYANTHWKCVCDCGNETIVQAPHLKSGHTASCGCYRKEATGNRTRTHGMCGTRVYRMWADMLTRCNNPEASGFEDYGGRGIRVCDRWFDFENFYADMGDPLPHQSLDRIDCDGDYVPSNCRWADDETQANNKRNTHWVEIKGLRMSLAQWVRFLGLNVNTISKRVYKYGWNEIRALTVPVRKCKRRKTNGIKHAA